MNETFTKLMREGYEDSKKIVIQEQIDLSMKDKVRTSEVVDEIEKRLKIILE